ncbi:DNA-dependent protein kinase catalytic subunit-like [Stegodyphus dumicola]|uniref:DNA-dependent protein kinase catalytic subunit-like n=1 Tax=Stegodyphus dumicola TaxID=202533 RepID=UPI0015B26C4C|nr:DNA-dependent protein kinase catalytic subunit-like [Stegodyphus dumicola]
MEIIANMLIDNMVTISSMSLEQKKKISEFCAINPENSQVGPLILNKCFMHLKSVIEMSSEVSKDTHQKETNSKEIASAHMELANFCNRYLRREADQNLDAKSIPSFGDFPLVLTESLLRALEYGYQEALQLFPRLLQIIESHPLCLQSFQKQVSKMPCWLFIGWINQMLALLDKPEAKAVQGIIENITLTYPDAIIYSFHLSSTNYKFNNPDGQLNKAFVERIKQILGKQTLIGDFVAALEHLSVPHVFFKEYISEIGYLMQRKALSNEIKCAFAKMYKDLFSEEVILGNQRISLGPLQKKFAEDFRADVIAICGKDGSKLTIQANQEATKKALTDLLTKMKLKDKKNYSLKDISPWLSAFQQWKYPVQIEIPGQYTGKFKPLPEYHVKVAGFDEKVKFNIVFMGIFYVW